MNFKTYITSTLLSCFLLTGCNSDNEKLIYESDTNCYVSFRTEKLNKEIEKDEDSTPLEFEKAEELKKEVEDVEIEDNVEDFEESLDDIDFESDYEDEEDM